MIFLFNKFAELISQSENSKIVVVSQTSTVRILAISLFMARISCFIVASCGRTGIGVEVDARNEASCCCVDTVNDYCNKNYINCCIFRDKRIKHFR